MPQSSTKRRPDKKNSNSIDANPIKSSSNNKLGQGPIARENSRSEISKNPIIVNNNGQSSYQEAFPRPPLSVALKLEVARQPAKQRPDALEVAYALEEMIQALEGGHYEALPRHAAAKFSLDDDNNDNQEEGAEEGDYYEGGGQQ